MIPADPPTEQIPVTAAGPVAPTWPPGRASHHGTGPTVAHDADCCWSPGLLGVLVLLYVGDLALGAGTVPRGVIVAGVAVGGLGLAEAEQRLRAEIEPRATQPVAVTVGGGAPARSTRPPPGSTVDWPGTLDRVGAQPLNPITRITSFFTDARGRRGAPRSTDAALDSALAALAPIVDRPPGRGLASGSRAPRPIPVEPVPGQQLDVPPGRGASCSGSGRLGGPVALPLIVLPPITTPEDVAAAIDEVARPAVVRPGHRGRRGRACRAPSPRR